MNNKKDKKDKKKSPGLGLIVFLLVFVIPQVMALLESDSFRSRFWVIERWLQRNGMDPELFPLLVAGALLLIALLIGRLTAARKKAKAETEARRPTTNASAGRTAAAKQRPDPRTRSFTPPEPSCIVCDHTGEDHFARDKAQRIAQLDEWLKNGLVDREEYRVLRDRYERDL